MAHTPLPWTIERRDRVGYTTITIGHEDAERACMVCEVGNELRQENVDNANLIAAAPDLLAVCEELLYLLESYQDEARFYLKGHYNRATNAIRKAKGVEKQ